MLLRAVRWSDDTVTAFDEAGRLIPELSGLYPDVEHKIRRETISNITVFVRGEKDNGSTMTVKEERFHAPIE